MSRRIAANTRIIFILARVPHHLRHGAAAAKGGAAKVFAAGAVLFGNLKALADRAARLAHAVNGPGGEEQVADEFENGKDNRTFADWVGNGSDFEGGTVHQKSGNQHDHHGEGLSRSVQGTGLSQPSQLHASHNCDCVCGCEYGVEKATRN